MVGASIFRLTGKLRKPAAARDEFVRGTLLNNMAAIKDDHMPGIPEHGVTVGDENGGGSRVE